MHKMIADKYLDGMNEVVATSSVNKEYHQNGVLTECRVCFGPTTRNHYGAATCNSCSVFFRRSVLQKRNYFCPKNQCNIRKDSGSQKICKACRFAACISAGMCIDSVWRRKLLEDTDQFKDCSILQKMLDARRAGFVNKLNVMTKLSAKLNIKMEMGSLKPGKYQTELSKLSEFEVLLIYMKDMGFEGFGLDQIDLVKIGAGVFYRWLLLSGIVVTLRNSGIYTNIAYFSDRGHIPINYDEIYDFLNKHEIKNVPILANSWHKVLSKAMKIAKCVHQSRLDKTEFSFLTLLLILGESRKLFPTNKGINDQLSELFQQMNKYFKENYSDTGTRLGNLVLLIPEINSIEDEVHEFAALMTLSNIETILNRILRSYGLLETVYN